MAFLTITNLAKRFGPVTALADISFSIERGRFLALLGPSGCGKTTLLRALAGLIKPDRGRITVADKDITDLSPHQRDVGMVFQDFALFPHMSVYDNIGFGLRMKGLDKQEIRTKVDEVLALVQLTGMEQRKPQQLSGGQQQRVALARALVTEPKVLLFDEPLSQLDAKLRKALQVWIRDLQRRLEITTVYVTHDQAEALALSDLIAVMQAGRIVQLAIPREIYRHPINGFAAESIGTCLTFRGKIERLAQGSGFAEFVSDLGERLRVAVSEEIKSASEVEIVVRPEDVAFVEQGVDHDSKNIIKTRVAELIFEGASYTVRLQCESGREIFLENCRAHWVEATLAVGDNISLSIPPHRLRIINQ